MTSALNFKRRPCECFGIPDTIVVDNGLDLTSRSVSDACLALEVSILFTPPREPWYKGVIERMGKTLNTAFVHWLPGTTFGQQKADYEYDPEKDASMTLEEFTEGLETFLFHVYNKTRHSTLNMSPLQKWRRGIAQWPIRLPAGIDDFNAIFALTETRTVQKQGIEYEHLKYQSEHLGRLWNRLPKGTKLTLKVDPTDIRVIRVIDPNTEKPFPVRCTTYFPAPLHLSYHLAVTKRANQLALDPEDEKDRAEAEASLRKQIDEAHKRPNRHLRRKAAAVQAGTVGTGGKTGRPSETKSAEGADILKRNLNRGRKEA